MFWFSRQYLKNFISIRALGFPLLPQNFDVLKGVQRASEIGLPDFRQLPHILDAELSAIFRIFAGVDSPPLEYTRVFLDVPAVSGSMFPRHAEFAMSFVHPVNAREFSVVYDLLQPIAHPKSFSALQWLHRGLDSFITSEKNRQFRFIYLAWI